MSEIKYRDFFSDLTDAELDKVLDEIKIEKNYDMVDRTVGVSKFSLGGLDYQVYVMLGKTPSNEDFGEISFIVLNHPDAKTDRERELFKFRLVGKSNNALPVLCKVFGSVWGYLEKNPLKYIYFSGKEDDRQKAYEKFATKHISKYLPEYERIFTDPNTGDEVNKSEFWFKRKN